MGNKIQVAVLFAVALASSLHSQSTGSATVTGACNIVITGNSNTATLQTNRCGLSTDQALKIVKLLNTLVTRRDAAQISAKLDELIALAQKDSQQTVVNAPITQSNVGGCNQQVVGGNGNTNNCAPPPMKMSDENFKRFAGVFTANNMGGEFAATVVLLASYDADAFELSKQICAPARYFHQPHACPYQAGPSVSFNKFMNLEADCANVAQAGLAMGGPFSINGSDPNQVISRNCMTSFSTFDLPTDGTVESDFQSSVSGLFCYFNGWDRPLGIQFKKAMEQAGLNCEYIGHQYQIPNERLLADQNGQALGAITVVIGSAPAQAH